MRERNNNSANVDASCRKGILRNMFRRRAASSTLAAEIRYRVGEPAKMGVPISWLDKCQKIGKVMTVGFMRADGKPVETPVYAFGKDDRGIAHFYEIIGILDNAKIDGKMKYKRLLIQEVFPVLTN